MKLAIPEPVVTQHTRMKLAIPEPVVTQHTRMKLTVPERDQPDNGESPPEHGENRLEKRENAAMPPDGTRNQGTHPPERNQKPRLG